MRSIGTKFILITLFVQIITSAMGGKLFYNFLSEQRFKQYEMILSTQSDLIAREVVLEKEQAPRFEISKLELADQANFQIVDLDGIVAWDSRDPKRAHMQIIEGHPLFSIANRSALKHGSTSFSIDKTKESFVGSYRKVLDRYIILGAVSKDAIESDILASLQHFFYLALFVFGLSLILIVFFTHGMVRPIRSLTDAAQKIANGNFDINLEPPGRDEVGNLSSSFTTMISRIRLLLEAEAQKSRMEEEVSIASEIQQKLLPPTDVVTSRYEFQSHYQSASETGGDYWGYIETGSSIAIYIGDVTGHGLPSAMLTAGVRGCFSALHYLSQQSNQPLIPEEILKYVNQAVTEIGHGELQMTLFVATYDFATRKLRYSNAAHNPAWIIRKMNGQYGVETLASRGPRLGEASTFVPGKTSEIQLMPDDILFFYSDGLVDNPNAAGETLGKAKIKELITQKINEKDSLVDLKNSIEFTIFEHHSGVTPLDDVTFSLVRFK